MTTYARNVNGHAIDVVTEDPTTLFHPDVASQFIEVPDGTEHGATFINGVWVNPQASAPDSSPAAALPLLTPMTLYMAFTPAERIAIKASTDPMVKEFWSMYELSVQLERPTDPNLISVKEALAYLKNIGILSSADRVDQILSGVPQ